MKPVAEMDLGKQLHDWAINEMQFQPTDRYVNTPLPSPEDFKKWANIFFMLHEQKRVFNVDVVIFLSYTGYCLDCLDWVTVFL